MNNLKINEAIALAKSKGMTISKLELAKKLWPESDDITAKANFCNLASGRSKKINVNAVPVLCTELGVSADYLFGLSNAPGTPEDWASNAAAKVLLDSAVKVLEKAEELLK